jgi:hypothetical protein
VGGDHRNPQTLLAANYPVMVESVTSLNPDDALGPNDDLWAAHYLLLTGYDDTKQEFTVQDSYRGPDDHLLRPARRRVETVQQPVHGDVLHAIRR